MNLPKRVSQLPISETTIILSAGEPGRISIFDPLNTTASIGLTEFKAHTYSEAQISEEMKEEKKDRNKALLEALNQKFLAEISFSMTSPPQFQVSDKGEFILCNLYEFKDLLVAKNPKAIKFYKALIKQFPTIKESDQKWPTLETIQAPPRFHFPMFFTLNESEVRQYLA
jgi:hypothetical protein